MKNNIYKYYQNGHILLTIEIIKENVYRAKNQSIDITARVLPLNEYKTLVECIEYKKADKNGKYRKTKKLLDHYMKWLDYILEEKGFIRKKKTLIW